MGISQETLFIKMNQELSLAQKAANQEEQKLHLYALKSLIEISLVEEKSVEEKTPLNASKSFPRSNSFPEVTPVKEMDLDDSANGNSLLDF